MRLLRVAIVMLAFFGAALFGSAGRFNLPFFWAYMAIVAVMMVLGPRWIDPELLKERMNPKPGGVDRKLRMLAMPWLAAHLVVSGLDVGRFHWSDTVPLWLQVVGAVGCLAFFSLSFRAMIVNRFFSPVVRIQSERGHHVIASGPYGWVRHPGYIGSLISMPCGGLMLGSWLGIVPFIPLSLLMLRRVVVEDRYLHDNLDGYADYARRVRYRLVPGLW
jgi:protein-S-isoprenylcysteine O-methyltransferase Ste14